MKIELKFIIFFWFYNCCGLSEFILEFQYFQ